MFNKYLFIPATNEKFLNKSKRLLENIQYIFDFEDSILADQTDEAIKLLNDHPVKNNDWIRINIDKPYLNQILKFAAEKSINNIVIPKFKGLSHLSEIFDSFNVYGIEAKVILLIENPKTLIDLEEILETYHKDIYGLAFGFHDFFYETDIIESHEIIKVLSLKLKLICESFNVKAIDSVTLNYVNLDLFVDDVRRAFQLGYRDKLLIHPNQIKYLDNIEFYSSKEVEKYKDILKIFENEVKDKKALFSYEGKIIEKMHIEKMKKIVTWGEDFYGINR